MYIYTQTDTHTHTHTHRFSYKKCSTKTVFYILVLKGRSFLFLI